LGDRGPRACRDLVTREQQVPAPIWLLARMRISWGGIGHHGPFGSMVMSTRLRESWLAVGHTRRSGGGNSGAEAQPPQLQALINSVAAGCGLHLYIRT